MSKKKYSGVSSFGVRLRQLRLSKGFRTQRNFAEKSGLTQPTIQRIESGQYMPSRDTLTKIAGVLKMSTEHLLTGKEGDNSPAQETAFSVVGSAAASVGSYGVVYDETEHAEVCYNNCFALNIVDDSMEPLARDGQRLLVDPAREIDHGDLVVADVGGYENEWVFKKYYTDGTSHQLVSLNSRMELPAIVLRKRPRMYKVVAILLES